MRTLRRLVTALLLVPAAFLLGSPVAAQEDASQNVRLQFQLVEANGFQEPDPAIAGVVDQLRDLFRFEGYRLLETSIMRTVLSSRNGPSSQMLAVEDFGRLEIEAWLSPTTTPGVARTVVRLRDANRVGADGNVSGPEIIDVTVNVIDDQTVVLGSGRPTPDRGALILIMTVEIEPEQR